MTIFLTMLLLGFLIGFVGVGGAALVVSVLVAFFNIPVHTALGVSLGAMAFTTLSGAYSHFRDGNVSLKIGGAISIFSAFGAFLGAKLAHFIPEGDLKFLTASLLFLSAVLVYLRLLSPWKSIFYDIRPQKECKGFHFWMVCLGIGLFNGLLSGTFGFGAAQFIQLSLLIFFILPLNKIVGTTMLIILPMGVFGSFGYLLSDTLDLRLLMQVVVALMIGAYLGAKFTKRAPNLLLKAAMISLPVISGILLLI